jgi:hypothetical protein
MITQKPQNLINHTIYKVLVLILLLLVGVGRMITKPPLCSKIDTLRKMLKQCESNC